jgi:uncharacterized protein (TIGR03000 family)
MIRSSLTAVALFLSVFSTGLTCLRAAEGSPADRAVLIVRLPADARLTIEAEPTAQRGSERVFESPRLPAGKSFVYTLVATWNEGDSARAVTRTASVRAGQVTHVDFQKAGPAPQANAAKARTFLFTYGGTITGLAPNQTARIWLPVPPRDEDQDVEMVSQQLPAEGHIAKEGKFGNKILYVEPKADGDGKIPFSVTYKVTRREVKGDSKDLSESADQLGKYLQPDALVPTSGKPLELIKDKDVPEDQLAAAHLFYDVVNGHMRYSKEGTGWGRGDSNWACDSRYGNCTDFHSLFISLARADRIPAKFEIGFPLPPQHGAGDIPGYHCWAKFRPTGRNWIPVDISEANKNPKMKDYYFGNLTEDRVTFSAGRDINLVPRQAGQPLNFFVYPYVEVEGKPYPAEKVQRKFSYKDVPAQENR